MSSLKREYRGLTLTITYTSPKTDWERKITFPARYEICDRCRGTGTHVNPSIDGNGISPEEFAEDPDFEEGYFSGRYDVRCEEGCDNGKIRVVEVEQLTRFQRIIFEAWEKAEEDRARWDAEDRRTRFWEDGGRFD